MLTAVLVTLAQVQEPAVRVHPEDPHHHVVAFEADDERRSLAWTVDFEGTLHVWVSADEGLPRLRVVRGEDVFEDQESGGPRTPYLGIEVAIGDRLTLETTSDGAHRSELHFVAAIETDATRAAAARAEARRAKIWKHTRAGNHEAAVAELVATVDELLDPSLPPPSWEVQAVAMKLALHANSLVAPDPYEKAISAVVACRERCLPPEHFEIGQAHLQVGTVRHMQGDLVAAHREYDFVHTIWSRQLPPEDRNLLRIKYALANMRFDLRDREGARELYEHVHETLTRTVDPDDQLLLRVKLAYSKWFVESGDIRRANELNEHVHAAFERLLPADSRDVLNAKSNLAWTRLALGDFHGALALQEQVVAARERTLRPDHPLLLIDKRDLAVTLRRVGNLAAALELLEYVHAAYTRLLPADSPRRLETMYDLAVTRRQIGDLAGALDLYQTILPAQERVFGKDHPAVLRALDGFGAVQLDLGDVAGAHEVYRRVLEVFPQTHSAEDAVLIGVKLNFAHTGLELGLIDESAALLEEALAALQDKREPHDHLLVLVKENLSDARELQGDLASADAINEELHTALESHFGSDFPAQPRLLYAKQDLARTRRRQGDLEAAHALERDVLERRESVLAGGHPELVSSRYAVADCLSDLGDAEGLREAILRLLQEQILRSRTLRAEAARPAREGMLEELERLGRAIAWTASLAPQPRRRVLRAAFETLEALRLSSTRAVAYGRASAADPDLAGAVRDLNRARRDAAAASQAAPNGDLDAWRKDIVERRFAIERMERSVSRRLAELGMFDGEPSANDLAKRLTPEAALVSTFRAPRDGGADALIAFVLTADGAVQTVDLGPSEPLEQLVHKWRASLGRPFGTRAPGLRPVRANPRSLEQHGKALRERVLDPILTHLTGVHTLHVVLDDFLYLVPLDVLPLGDGVVGDRFRVHCATNVAPLMESSAAVQGAVRMVVVGGVDYAAEPRKTDANQPAAARPPVDLARERGRDGLSFERLPGTAAEAEAVAELFAARFETDPVLLLESEADKSRLLQHAPGARYLHIATHGWFARESDARSMLDTESSASTEPNRDTQRTIRGFMPETLCGLALAGANRGADELGRVPGVLTAEELATLDLSGCELAVLSACETNVGIRRAGQGIQSLQSALHAAGARTAITSLWKVDDAATRRLMELFYKKLWNDALGQADALWAAKMELRRAGLPLRDWAGWVLTGAVD